MPTRNGHDTIADRRRRAPRAAAPRSSSSSAGALNPLPTPALSRYAPKTSQSPGAQAAPTFPHDVRLPPAPGNGFAPPPKRQPAKRPTKAKSTGKSAPTPNHKTQNTEKTGKYTRNAAAAAPHGGTYQTKPRQAAKGEFADLPQATPLVTGSQSPAIPLPKASEPQVLPAPPTNPEQTRNRADAPLPAAYAPTPPVAPVDNLPRNRALTSPAQGFVAAISSWLRSTGQRVASGFLVTKRRPVVKARPPAAQVRRTVPTPVSGEQASMAQLQAENRRLRAELEALTALRAVQPASPAPASIDARHRIAKKPAKT